MGFFDFLKNKKDAAEGVMPEVLEMPSEQAPVIPTAMPEPEVAPAAPEIPEPVVSEEPTVPDMGGMPEVELEAPVVMPGGADIGTSIRYDEDDPDSAQM